MSGHMPGSDSSGTYRVLLRADSIYQWRGRKMGRTIFNVRRGILVLTESHLIFACKGGTDVWWKLVVESAGFVPGVVGNAKTIYDVARAVDDAGDWVNRKLVGEQNEPQYFAPDAQVLKDGSFMVPLPLLEGYGVEIFREFGFWCSYLWVTFLDHDGQSRAFTFSDKHVIPGGKAWEEAITAAREASPRGG